MLYIILMLLSITLSACVDHVKKPYLFSAKTAASCHNSQKSVYDIRNIDINKSKKNDLFYYELLEHVYDTKSTNRYYNELQKPDMYHEAQKPVYDDKSLLRPRRCRRISEEKYIDAIRDNILLNCN